MPGEGGGVQTARGIPKMVAAWIKSSFAMYREDGRAEMGWEERALEM